MHPNNYAKLSLNNCNADYIHIQSVTITYFILIKTNSFTSTHLMQSVAGRVFPKYDCSC